MSKKATALIDNSRKPGHAIKLPVSEALKKKSFLITAIGIPSTWADEVILSPKPTEKNIDDLSIDNYKIYSYGSFNLWGICKGNLAYEDPSTIECDHASNFQLIYSTYSTAISLIDRIDRLFFDGNIGMTIVWGGMFFEGIILAEYSRRYGVKCFAIEFSFDPNGFYFDPSGIIGNKISFPGSWKSRLVGSGTTTQQKMDMLSEWKKNNTKGKSKQQPIQTSVNFIEKGIIKADKSNILLLCQCFIDTVIKFDNPFFSTSLHAYYAVAAATANKNINLIIKTHPGDLLEIQKRIESLELVFSHVRVISVNNNENVYSLMDACDAGITINSQSGLEMLSRYKNVLTIGSAFYGGLGFNLQLPSLDLLDACIDSLLDNANLSETQRILVDNFLSDFLFDYLIPFNDAENRISQKIGAEDNNRSNCITSMSDIERSKGEHLRIIIIHPSPQFGGSGFYLQEVAERLTELGHRVMILCEGSCVGCLNNIQWHQISFSGPLLDPNLLHHVVNFCPNVIFQVGVRTKSMRVSLELYIATRAMFVVQAEDDEFIPYKSKAVNPNLLLLEILDKPHASWERIDAFCRHVNWIEFTKMILDPNYYRWVDPVLRSLCYHAASMHCAIWHPMANRLKLRFNKRSFVLPPVINIEDYSPACENFDRAQILNKYNINDGSFVIFVAGTIYDFSDEFGTFITALLKARKIVKSKITLVVTGRSRGNIHRTTRDKLRGKINYRSLGIPNDQDYINMIKASDLVCAPGFDDEFNEFRLPSRLVKAMTLGVPVLTFECGFGQSLKNFYNAILISGNSAIGWSKTISQVIAMDKNQLRNIGANGRHFAINNFNSRDICKKFASELMDAIKDHSKFLESQPRGAAPPASRNRMGKDNAKSKSTDVLTDGGRLKIRKSKILRKSIKLISKPRMFFYDFLKNRNLMK